MKREQTLRRRLKSLETMSDAVAALKSLSAHHLRSARAALNPAREYLAGVETALAAARFPIPVETEAPAGLLVLASDLGMCGSYISKVTRAAVENQAKLHAQRLYCVGRRPAPLLKRSDLPIYRIYRATTSIAGLTDLLLTLAHDLLGDWLDGSIATLDVVSARFDGVGEFTPVSQRLLPIATPQATVKLEASPYVTQDHFRAVILREFLYIRLFQILLDALASEHGARLVATTSAGDWLANRVLQTQHQLSASRQESATQEVLEIASGARLRKKTIEQLRRH